MQRRKPIDDLRMRYKLVRVMSAGSALLLLLSCAVQSFSYNAFGARVSKTDSSGSFTFARAGASSGAAILSDGTAAYTPGISERRSSVSRFYHFGGNGENGRETGENETTSSTRTWDAWGNQLSSTGSTNSPFGAFGGSGSETEGDSDLIYSGNGAFYDPSTGRFISIIVAGTRSGGYGHGGGSNNPVGVGGPDGPSIAPVVPVANGGGYIVGPEPKPEYYGMLSGPGRGDYAGGSTEGAFRRVGRSALDAVINHPFIPIPAVGVAAKAGRAVNNARKVSGMTLNLLPKIDGHHLLPRQFEDWFHQRGIRSIHDYIIKIDRELHKRIHGKGGKWKDSWNGLWRAFIDKYETGPQPSPEEILEKAEELRRHFGI